MSSAHVKSAVDLVIGDAINIDGVGRQITGIIPCASCRTVSVSYMQGVKEVSRSYTYQHQVEYQTAEEWAAETWPLKAP